MRASLGISRGGFVRALLRSTWAYIPGSRAPSPFGTWTSTSSVRLAGSRALALRATVPRNSRGLGRDPGKLHLRPALQKIAVYLVECRLLLLQVRPGLADLLIQLGRFDFSQRLSGLNPVTDVHQPPFYVTFGPGENGRLRD